MIITGDPELAEEIRILSLLWSTICVFPLSVFFFACSGLFVNYLEKISWGSYFYYSGSSENTGDRTIISKRQHYSTAGILVNWNFGIILLLSFHTETGKDMKNQWFKPVKKKIKIENLSFFLESDVKSKQFEPL